MISLCSVLIDALNPFLEIYLEWVSTRTKLISEVCLCKIDENESYYKEWTTNNIVFKKFGYKFPETHLHLTPGHQHALGMHECIDKSTQPYIFLCDPDIFFYIPVDEFYFKLMEKYELDVVGASHHSSTEIAQKYFPWHGNLLVAKEKLPNSEFLKNKFAIEGKYLLMDPVPGYTEMFPNPNGNFDTASYLWLWAHQQNWKWLAFQTTDCHVYNSMYHRGNVKIDKVEKKNLFYHAVSGSIKPWETSEPFKRAYEESKEDDDEDD